MCYRENKSLFFLASLKMTKFFFRTFVIFNTITDSFLVEKWGTLEHARNTKKFIKIRLSG